MAQDAQNENRSAVTWSKVFSEPSGAPDPIVDPTALPVEKPATRAENTAAKPGSSGVLYDTITGDYSALDDIHQRPEAVVGQPIASGAFKVTGSSLISVCGDADLLALGQSRVCSWGHAKVAGAHDSMIFATDQVKVTASGNASVCATGKAKVYASDDVIVVALDRTEIYASGHVKIKAFGSCTVYASGESEVEVAATTGCVVYLYGNARQVTVADSGQ